ncbi:FecR domain-containing protein [Calycomorphotria hydatis]|uniref:FecR protein n=1 Tax=Calycomorphotria hydatis TaxID=2528027 RepID=A0A517T8I1_9PLAN|nr:FecR domain-containing protein [Calycomorphotria hydatis]QDT64677.1 FecR protein [Calycomorphotria hydatis]
MASNSPEQTAIRVLLDDIATGRSERNQIAKLNAAIRADPSLLSEIINFAQVEACCRNFTDHQSSLDLLVSAAKQQGDQSRTDRSTHRWATLGSISSIALVLLIGVMLSFYRPLPPVSCKLIGLTADARWGGQEYNPGDLVLERMTLTLEQGIASFELVDGAIVSIHGPTTIETTNGQETKLIDGTLHAFVSHDAVGYTVNTIDAEVVDLGTEFIVERREELGTRVVVKQGKVEARAINASGPGSVYELSAGWAREFHADTGLVKDLAELQQWEKQFESFENARGGITRLDGIVRTTPSFPADLRPTQMPTNNYIMLVREAVGIELQEDLVIQQEDGPVSIRKGTLLDSYLLHFAPSVETTRPPIGTVQFTQPVVALVRSTDDLRKTDAIVSDSNRNFPLEQERGLEAGADRIEISDDRKTVSVHFGREANEDYARQVDQARIWVLHSTN